MNHRFGSRLPEPDTPCARVLSLPIRYVWALPNTLIGLLFVPTAMLPRGRMQLIDGVLEAHGPLIAAILRRCVPIPSGAPAITFGRVVFNVLRGRGFADVPVGEWVAFLSAQGTFTIARSFANAAGTSGCMSGDSLFVSINAKGQRINDVLVFEKQ